MKKILFILIMAILWFPMIQEKIKLIKFKPLAGVTVPPQKPELNKKTWFEGSFQQQYENFKGSKYGSRDFLIRLYNQVDYSFFRLTHSGVVIGKEDYLFETNYLTERTGITFAGNEAMNSMLRNVNDVQHYLASQNILLVTLLAPGKAYYYEEFIPEYYRKKLGSEHDYGTLLHYSKDYELNMIDANGWFLKIKDTTHLPLFPKQGIHWNHYGMALCADTVIKYIEAKTNVDLPDVTYTIDIPKTLQGTDNDIGDMLNLLFKQSNPLMPYPRFSFEYKDKKKLRLLAVGDSFYWTIFGQGIYNNVFDNQHYYYYNHTIYGNEGERKESPADYNILREIKNYDVIFLIQSTPNYQNIGAGFVQLVQKQIKHHEDLKNNYLNKINNENQYPDLVSNYSRLNKVSIDSATTFIADSLAMSYMDQLSKFRFDMRNNPDWMPQLEAKAWQQGVSLEEVMEKDAQWMMEQKK